MSSSWLKVVARILLAVGGGYFASSAVMEIFCFLLVALGMSRSDAVTLGIMLVFVLYLCLLLWVFAETTLWRSAAMFLLLIVCGYGVSSFVGHGS